MSGRDAQMLRVTPSKDDFVDKVIAEGPPASPRQSSRGRTSLTTGNLETTLQGSKFNDHNQPQTNDREYHMDKVRYSVSCGVQADMNVSTKNQEAQVSAKNYTSSAV